MEYYLAIKRNAFESVLTRRMNLEPIIQNEVSQKEKDKLSYSNAYISNLEKWYRRIYLQGSSGKTDIENRPMDMAGGEKGDGEMYRESNLETHISIYTIDNQW